MNYRSKLLSAFVGTALLGTSLLAIEKDANLDSNVQQLQQEQMLRDQKQMLAEQEMERAKQASSTLTTQATLENTITSLAIQLLQNKKIDTDKAFAVTSFVRLDNLKKTSEFGRILSESMMNELSIRGFNVTEFRGQMSLSVNENGEYLLSRDAQKLKNSIQNQYVVVGTYSRQYKRIMVNARIVDNISGKVISSGRVSYAHGLKDDCSIFKDCKPPRTIKIVPEK